MTRSTLELQFSARPPNDNCWRTVFRNQHGRRIYLEVCKHNNAYLISRCFYADRNRHKSGVERFFAVPLKLAEHPLPLSRTQLLEVIALELDKSFSDISFSDLSDTRSLSVEDFCEHCLSFGQEKRYRFLIFAALSDKLAPSGLPAVLATRLKNKLHRSIFLKLTHLENGKGVITACHYYDRQYRDSHRLVTPPTVYSVFISYDKASLLQFVNNELECDFTHIIVTPDDEFCVESNPVPLCGYL